MKLRLHIAFLFLIIFCITVFANGNDYYYTYTYDNAGNRISRNITQERTRFESPHNMETHNEISVYPTVTTGLVNIATTLDVSVNTLTYCLSNLQGSVLMQGKLLEQFTQLSLPYTPGIYLLSIHTNSTQQTFKIIIQ